MTERALLCYEEELLEVDGEYDYHSRSYKFRPVYESGRGMFVTAAFRMCRECNAAISSMGGGGNRYVCLTCYPALKVADFAEGHTHAMSGE
jgi:hypothetical protein